MSTIAEVVDVLESARRERVEVRDAAQEVHDAAQADIDRLDAAIAVFEQSGALAAGAFIVGISNRVTR